METISFSIYEAGEITESCAGQFIDLLVKQGKVKKPPVAKIQSCRKIIFCSIGDKRIGIGAIKPKTPSDFETAKADLPNLSKDFIWELGYMYVTAESRGLGLSSMITKLLLNDLKNENLVASTELYDGNPMVLVLQKNGFHLMGKPWKSSLHDGYLGLFVKFKKGEYKKMN